MESMFVGSEEEEGCQLSGSQGEGDRCLEVPHGVPLVPSLFSEISSLLL